MLTKPKTYVVEVGHALPNCAKIIYVCNFPKNRGKCTPNSTCSNANPYQEIHSGKKHKKL